MRLVYLTFTTFINYGFGSVPENFVDFSCLEPSNAFGTFQKVADAKEKECVAYIVHYVAILHSFEIPGGRV